MKRKYKLPGAVRAQFNNLVRQRVGIKKALQMATGGQLGKYEVPTRRKKSMAKRHKFRHYARKAAKGGKDFLSGTGGQLILAASYGFLRQKTSAIWSQYTNKLPGGEISDEIGLGLLCIAGKKFAPKGKLRAVFSHGLTVEAARIGDYIATKGVGGLLPGQTTNTSQQTVW